MVVTKLDRLARSLHQLVAIGRELEALGFDLVVLVQAIDTTTPSGRLLFHLLGAIAEFERDLIRDRVIGKVAPLPDHDPPAVFAGAPKTRWRIEASGSAIGAEFEAAEGRSTT